MNLFHHEGGPHWFSRGYLLSIVGLTLLTSFFVAGVGVFISLRAATVKQAQQTFGIAMVVVLMAPVLVIQAMPHELRRRLAFWFAEIGHTRLLLGVALVLLILGLLINGWALARFRRGRLVLD